MVIYQIVHRPASANTLLTMMAMMLTTMMVVAAGVGSARTHPHILRPAYAIPQLLDVM